MKCVPYCERAKCCDSIWHHQAPLEGKVHNLTFYIIFVNKNFLEFKFLINTESFLILIGLFFIIIIHMYLWQIIYIYVYAIFWLLDEA